jgi:hypoxanthine phosphoribosyltransferase
MSSRNNPILVPKVEIDSIVKRLGEEISKDYKDKPLILVVVLKGSIIFASDLIRQISIDDLKVDFVRVSSYGMGARISSGNIKLWKDISVNTVDSDVLIVEDIIDTGNTLKFLYDRLVTTGANSVKVCSLLDKKCRREANINSNYTGKIIDDKYVYGYGLDLDELCRNYPDIHYIKG